MKAILNFALATAVLSGLAFTANAQEPAGKPPRNHTSFIERLDADKDGKITRDEFVKASVQRAARDFERLDTDGDGTVTAAEFEAARQDRKGKPPGHPDHSEKPGRPAVQQPPTPPGVPR